MMEEDAALDSHEAYSGSNNTHITGSESVRAAQPIAARPVTNRASVQLGGKKQRDPAATVCHVCGKEGHCAGFVGSVYVDCPYKPCYLCKQNGHTTMACPYRITPTGPVSEGHGQGQARANGDMAGLAQQRRDRDGIQGLRGMLGSCSPVSQLVAGRSLQQALCPSPSPALHGAASLPLPRAWPRRHSQATVPPLWRVESAVLRLHSRRITCALIPVTHPGVCVTGDKSGELGIWSHGGDKADRQVYGAHRYLINACAEDALASTGTSLRLWTASADGTVRLHDVGRRSWSECLDLNPGGWTGNEKAWRMAYAIAAPGLLPGPMGSGAVGCVNAHCPVLAGDDQGRVWGLDARTPHGALGWVHAHDKGSKVNSLQYNPLQAGLVVSASADWTVRLWDVRKVSWASVADGGACGGSGSALGQPEGPSTCTTTRGAGGGPGVAVHAPNSLVQALANSAVGLSPGRGHGPTEGDVAGMGNVDQEAGDSGGGQGEIPARGQAGQGEGGAPGGVASSPAAGTKRIRAPKRPAEGPGTLVPLSVLAHPRVVMHAAFSPWTGQKLATTCADNRIRVWTDVAGAACGGAPPARELPHSHDWSRYLAPFRAHWYGPDQAESSLVVGRYISESFTARSGASIALHPVDIVSVEQGGMVPTGYAADRPAMSPSLLASPATGTGAGTGSGAGTGGALTYRSEGPLHVRAQLADPIQDKICPVLAVHPYAEQHCIISCASNCVYLWKPMPHGAVGKGMDWRADRGEQGEVGSDSDDDGKEGIGRGRRREPVQEPLLSSRDGEGAGAGSASGAGADDATPGPGDSKKSGGRGKGKGKGGADAKGPGGALAYSAFMSTPTPTPTGTDTGSGTGTGKGKAKGKGKGKESAGASSSPSAAADSGSTGQQQESLALLRAWQASMAVLDGPGVHYGRAEGSLPFEGGEGSGSGSAAGGVDSGTRAEVKEEDEEEEEAGGSAAARGGKKKPRKGRKDEVG